MATAVASRFAVLSLDVEDDTGKPRKSDKKKALNGSGDAPASKGKGSSKQQDAKKKASAKKKPDSQGSKKSNNGQQQQQKNNSKQSGNKEQWEEWKKKDQEFVSDSYEHDLQEAILKSQLEFEEVRKLRKAQGLDVSGLDKEMAKKKLKPQKAQTMSLDQFNKMNGQKNKKKEEDEEPSEEDANFFEKINEIAAIALDQELKTEKFKARQAEPETDVHVTIAQYQNVLEKKNKEILVLKETVEKLDFELNNVKARNSKLCAMLAQGEMKDKVDVLLEVERLKTGREELLTEVASLHALLEQERSKVHDLTKQSDKQKSKGKK